MKVNELHVKTIDSSFDGVLKNHTSDLTGSEDRRYVESEVWLNDVKIGGKKIEKVLCLTKKVIL